MERRPVVGIARQGYSLISLNCRLDNPSEDRRSPLLNA